MEAKFIFEPLHEGTRFPGAILFINHNGESWKVAFAHNQEELDTFKQPKHIYDYLMKDGVETYKIIHKNEL